MSSKDTDKSGDDVRPELDVTEAGGNEEEEEEEEPKLKYKRLGNDLAETLTSTGATCAGFHELFTVIGTSTGEICVFDMKGNIISKYSPHDRGVNDISIDISGQFIASCSDDGTVAIKKTAAWLNDPAKTSRPSPSSNEKIEDAVIIDYRCPLMAICLDPLYAKSLSFCVGGKSGKCIINRKGWFGHTNTVVHEGEGPITAIAWSGECLAWKNDIGVKIYDVSKEMRISYVESRVDRADDTDVRVCLVWETPSRLLIGWADSIQIVEIVQRRAPSGKCRSLAEIVGVFKTPYYVCGLSPWGADALVVLAVTPRGVFSSSSDEEEEQDDEEEDVRPELHVISRKTGEEHISDVLALRGQKTFGPVDCALHFVKSAPSVAVVKPSATTANFESLPTLYVVSRRDIVVARAGDPEDRIKWSLSRREFARALAIARAHDIEATISPALKRRVGDAYLRALTNAGRWSEAAVQIPSVLRMGCDGSDDDGRRGNEKREEIGKDERSRCSDADEFSDSPLARRWEHWIRIFTASQNTRTIALIVPTSAPRLSRGGYATIVESLVSENDFEALADTVKRWTTTKEGAEGKIDGLVADQTNKIIDPSAFIDIDKWIAALSARAAKMASPEDETARRRRACLDEAIATLYEVNGEYEIAANVYVESPVVVPRNPSAVFALIEDRRLFESKSFLCSAMRLVDMDESGAIELLVRSQKYLPVSSILKQIGDGRPKLQLSYLHAIFQCRRRQYGDDECSGRPFYELQIELYIEHESEETLLAFLKDARDYSLTRAFELCALHSPPLFLSMAFLKERMGNMKEALHILVNDLCAYKNAIAMIDRHGDRELWDELVSMSLSKNFVVELLDHITTTTTGALNPLKLIEKIPSTLEINYVGEKIVDVLKTSHVERKLRHHFSRILTKDIADLMSQHYRAKVRGVRVSQDSFCRVCHERVNGRAIVVSRGGGIAHEACADSS
eukprot:g2393.t1